MQSLTFEFSGPKGRAADLTVLSGRMYEGKIIKIEGDFLKQMDKILL